MKTAKELSASREPGMTAPRQRIEIKVAEELKGLITRAAAARGQGISEFVRAAAERAARDIIAEDLNK